jgi:hypothetical protein
VLLVIFAFGHLTLQHTQEKSKTAKTMVSEIEDDAKQSFPMNPSSLNSWRDHQFPHSLLATLAEQAKER